jgi:hypothetical protein
MMACGDCKHFEPQRNELTGRPMPSYPGRCTYPVQWPEVPDSYLQVWGRLNVPSPLPVWRHSCKSCKMFEKKGRNPKKSGELF